MNSRNSFPVTETDQPEVNAFASDNFSCMSFCKLILLCVIYILFTCIFIYLYVYNNMESVTQVMAGMESRPDGSLPEKGSEEEQIFQERKDAFVENVVVHSYQYSTS